MIHVYMITPLGLVSMHLYIVTKLFSFNKNIKKYSLSNFQLYNRVLLTIATVLYI